MQVPVHAIRRDYLNLRSVRRNMDLGESISVDELYLVGDLSRVMLFEILRKRV